MKHGLPTCADPVDANAFYVRVLYSTFFYGPFEDEGTLTAAINHLDATVEWWDYDCFAIMRGLTPLPTDYVFGFPFIEPDLLAKIEAQRMPFALRPQPRT